MKKIFKVLFWGIFLVFLVTETQLKAHFCATCSSAGKCNACKNCKYCKHCSKDGGTCSVCK